MKKLEGKNTTPKYVDPNISGSATGSPRSKVSLKPGHSLMDWIRLGNSGKDLTGVNGILQDVTPSQLANHNKRNDAWLAIRGKVYNVTHYMDFHPGGEDELMRGIGKDATELFNQVHPWVNYDSLLQKCIVGHLRSCDKNKIPDYSALLFGKDNPVISRSENDSVINTTSKTVINEETRLSRDFSNPVVPLEWVQKSKCVSVVYFTKAKDPQVNVCLRGCKDLSVYFRYGEKFIVSHLILQEEVAWPCKVTLKNDTGKVELEFDKKQPKIWQCIGVYCEDDGTLINISEIQSSFESWIIVSVTPVNHNTKLFVLRHELGMLKTIPVGHHIHVRTHLEGMEVVRSYTPVVPALCDDFIPHDWTAECMCLMVKEYTSGLLTPWLSRQQPGDKIELCGPKGCFQTQQFGKSSHIYLLAAGTGITPMLSLMTWCLDKRNMKCKKLKLLFFNRTEEDILWREQLERLQNEDSRFEVTHYLSEEVNWNGQKDNVISKSMLESLVSSTPDDASYYMCVCGPKPFMDITRKLLGDINCPSTQYHCFEG